MNNSEGRALEDMVREYGLAYVVSLLSVVAANRATLIRADWRDEATAEKWDRAAGSLDKTAVQLERTLK